MRQASIHFKLALALLGLLCATHVHAQRLMESNGVELRGTARVLDYGAATCHVREENHSEEEYERLKVNEGKPLDVWQLDFSVYNGSGKALDHLVARYWIEADWPPCTNWSAPARDYGEIVQWGTVNGNIQRSGKPSAVAPGETLTEEIFIIAFHTDTPRFSQWSVDFNFADGARATPPPPAPPAAPATTAPPVAAPAPPAGRDSSFRDRSQAGAEGPEMMSIPGGTFRMGDLSGAGFDYEKPVHSVTVPAFRLGKYEVTLAQWDACVADGGCGGYTPDDEGWGRGNRPVINVSWDDVQGFIAWLNNRTGGNYRLPTEAEWEYAARAGSTTEYSWGNDIGQNRANCDGCGSQWDDRQTAPVGSFAANAWGLHNMHGNVSEWVQDCMTDSYVGSPTDGSAWTSGRCGYRGLRGSTWFNDPRFLRSAYRGALPRSYRGIGVGFRLAQDN